MPHYTSCTLYQIPLGKLLNLHILKGSSTTGQQENSCEDDACLQNLLIHLIKVTKLLFEQ